MGSSEKMIETVLTQLAIGPQIVVELVREVPHSILRCRPAPGVWSAHEHACHLPAVQPLMLQRLEYMLNDPSPVITPYDPSTDEPDGVLLKVDLDEAMDRFIRGRAALVKRLRQLAPAEWDVVAEHGEYSHYSVFIMFRHLALHDLYHAYRIEERLLRRSWSDAVDVNHPN